MELRRFHIKKMDMIDLDEVHDIETVSSANPWSKKMFVEEMKNPFAYCFIIKIKGMLKHPVMGYICFRNIEDESELLNICVHPEYRQMGIAKKLMQFYIEFCGKRKIKTFYLEVNALNQPAIHLYHLFFYQPLGRRKKFYQEEFDALLMVKKTESAYGITDRWDHRKK
jgi:ribosomal-protein-alanine N-acetyltransferase